jgi:putative ABC transport system permease protein
MFKNNLKIAWRNLIKDRQFTVLNILGLSAGLACSLLIWLWVNDELSFDKFNEKDSQLYQLMENRYFDGSQHLSDESSGILGETIARDMPEVEYAAALAPPEWYQQFTLTVGDKNLKATGQYAGKDYFNIFSFKLLEGKKDQVLADKSSIVISENLARRLFNTTENIIGKTIRFQHERDFSVSGVFEQLPSHSSQQFDFVLSFEYLKDVQDWVKTWGNTGPHNFILLKKGTDINAFNNKISGIIRKYTGDTIRTASAVRFSSGYLGNSFVHGSRVGGRIEYVRLFSIIAIFILAIACINFMNLSTAKASRRMKEVGIKKVVGASRKQVIFQFLTESLLLSFLSMLLAVGVAWLLLPQFNQLTGKEMRISFDPSLVLVLLSITLFTGLLSGSYPALYLSGFRPAEVLKGKFSSSIGEVLARKGLVVFQFTLSVMLIFAVLVVYKQIRFIQSTNPGYVKDHVIRFESEGRLQSTEETFTAGLRKIPGVVDASFTTHNMVGRNYGTTGLSWEGEAPNENLYFEGFFGGFDFIETMGMQMAEGRSFSKNFGNDTNKIILNESAVRAMRLKDPIGKNVKLFNNTQQIIGVVKDFHFESLHEPVKPSFILLGQGTNPWFKIMVRLKAGQEKATIDRIRGFYESYNPGFPFSYSFLDDAYQKQYESESRVAILSRYFAGLAIIISCLGLFGLAAFTAQRRQKEIGIRKVVGASANNIAFMLSGDFLKLIGFALLIAFPVSWILMNNWLQTFAYRIQIGASVFLAAGLAVLGITLLTIFYQSVKAAIANPVKSLRSE